MSKDYRFCVSTLLSYLDSITIVLYRLVLISTILNLDLIEDAPHESEIFLYDSQTHWIGLEFRIAKPI